MRSFICWCLKKGVPGNEAEDCNEHRSSDGIENTTASVQKDSELNNLIPTDEGYSDN